MKWKLTQRNLIIGLIVIIMLILIQPFAIPYIGGWEVRTAAVRAKMDTVSYVATDPAQWQHDFDAPYHGAPDLVIDAGQDPVHVNEYFSRAPEDEPIKTISKTTTTREYLYDVHLYTLDITLRTDGDAKITDDFGANSIESECSYANDREGDGGAHRFTVQFVFEINQWERFKDELNSWAGVMTVYTYKMPDVGTQPYNTKNLVSGLSYDFRGDYTEVIHNPFPGTQGSKLNMWTAAGQVAPHLNPDGVAPDAKIPVKIYFDLAVEFRAGALVGKDGVGNKENIYILDPFVIFHLAFEVMTIHEFYLESEPIQITQKTPVPSGSPGTEETGGPFWDRISDWLNAFWPFGGLQGLVIFVVIAVIIIAVAPTAISALFGRKILR